MYTRSILTPFIETFLAYLNDPTDSLSSPHLFGNKSSLLTHLLICDLLIVILTPFIKTFLAYLNGPTDSLSSLHLFGNNSSLHLLIEARQEYIKN